MPSLPPGSFDGDAGRQVIWSGFSLLPGSKPINGEQWPRASLACRATTLGPLPWLAVAAAKADSVYALHPYPSGEKIMLDSPFDSNATDAVVDDTSREMIEWKRKQMLEI